MTSFEEFDEPGSEHIRRALEGEDLDDALSVSLHHPSARVFWPTDSDQPFQRCVVCERVLSETRQAYLVERAFHGHQPVFEYAMCWGCRADCSKSMSAQSTQRITAHFQEHVDMEARVDRLLDRGADDVGPWLERCVLTKAPRATCERYQIAGLAYRDRLLLCGMPLLIGDEALERIQRLLSKASRDAMDDFSARFLGSPPEHHPAPSLY